MIPPCVCRNAPLGLKSSISHFSVVYLFCLISYVLFPLILTILYYTFPFILFASFIVAFFLSSKNSNIQILNHENKSAAAASFLGNASSSRKTFEIRQRKTEEKSESIVERKIESSNLKSSSSLGEKAQVISDEKKSIKIHSSVSDLLQSQRSYESGVESSETDDDEEGGGAVEIHGVDALEWTEDDQRNLMDVGLSEIERNRRVENLIAKRSAKKLIGAEMEKSSSDATTIVTSCRPIENADDPNSSSSEEIKPVKTPGSAPSVWMSAEEKKKKNPLGVGEDKVKPFIDLSENEPSIEPERHDAIFEEKVTTREVKESKLFSGPPSFDPEPVKLDQDDMGLNPFPGTEKWALEELGYSRPGSPTSNGNHDRLVGKLLSDFDTMLLDESNNRGHESFVIKAQTPRFNAFIKSVESDEENTNGMSTIDEDNKPKETRFKQSLELQKSQEAADLLINNETP